MTGISVLATTGCCHAQQKRAVNRARDVRVLSDRMPGIDTGHVRKLVEHLRNADLPVSTISCAEMADAAVLTPERVGTLVLTNSTHFPAAAFGNLMAFLRGGGDLVLMGGHAFRHSIFRTGDQWQTSVQYAQTLAASTTARNALFGFENSDLGQWQHGASNKAATSRIQTVPGKTGKALRLDLKDVTWYDVWGAALQSEIPKGHNAICLWLKADPDTKQFFVEMTEKDGTRWSRAVDVTPEWRFQVLPATTFLFKADGAAPGRGGKMDGLKMGEGAKLTVGLAKDRTPAVGASHTFWIDEVGTVAAPPELAVADRALAFRGAFNDYDVYRFDGAPRVRTHAGQDWLQTPVRIDGPVGGLSAVGFALPHESTFVPLLAAEDDHGRVQGWAAGMLIHHAGEYAGSQWGLFGVEAPSFYENEQAIASLVGLLRGFNSGKWVERARQEDVATNTDRLELRSPQPPPLRIKDKHFVYPDGRRFFMIGVNFWSSFDTFYGGGPQWDVRRLERDFARMERAGINSIRIHGFNRFALAAQSHRLQTFLELCRRHRIYVLAGVGLGKHSYLKDGKDAMQAEAKRLGRLLKDETVILGYDLQNEPYHWEIERSPFDGTTLAKRFPVPKGGWGDYFQSLKVCEGNWSSTFPGLKGRLPVPEDPRLRQTYDNVNATMGTWIGWLVEAIRSEDKSHAITVGYNTIFDCLPANQVLDFVSHHVYEAPESLVHVRRNHTTLDRLRHIWPDRPVSLGEFGYSSGDLINGKYLDIHTQAVGEITHWLYALAEDYDGAMKWQLCDSTPAYQWRFATWRRKEPEPENLRQRRFGMFWPDGTPEGRPKPIVHATRFLRDCVDAGLSGGELELREDTNLIGTGYVYRAKNALFVGGSSYTSAKLSVESELPANVMLRWDAQSLTILATADATVLLAPDRFLSNPVRNGKERDRAADGRIRLQLFEGKPVVLTAGG